MSTINHHDEPRLELFFLERYEWIIGFSLNSRVVGTLRLETEASYGLRSSPVLQIVFFEKTGTTFKDNVYSKRRVTAEERTAVLVIYLCLIVRVSIRISESRKADAKVTDPIQSF